MIQANELRIGNLVNYTCSCNEVYPVKVKMIEYESCIHGEDLSENYFCKKCGQNFYKLSFDFLSGIPITEDILLKAGFEKNGSYKEIKLNQVSITIKLLDGEYFLVDASGWYGKGFIYLHSLQNLIYALTGTELTINL